MKKKEDARIAVVNKYILSNSLHPCYSFYLIFSINKNAHWRPPMSPRLSTHNSHCTANPLLLLLSVPP